MGLLQLLTCCTCFSIWAFCNYWYSVMIQHGSPSFNTYLFSAIVPLVASFTVFIFLTFKLAKSDMPINTAFNLSSPLYQVLIMIVAGFALGASYLLYYQLLQSNQTNSVLILLGNVIVVFFVFKLITTTSSGNLLIDIHWSVSLREVFGLMLCLLGILVLKFDVFMSSISVNK